ncbi:hypothetical protein VCHENC02_3974B, partial [Vibrio harveyi]
VTKNFCFG